MKSSHGFLVVLVGLMAGYIFGQSSIGSASADRQYKECFSARLWNASGPDVNEGNVPKLVRVPSG